MADDAIIKIAKEISTGVRADVTREFFIQEIEKRASEYRQPGESREQVFARFATTTADGQALLKASLRARPAAMVKAEPGGAYSELMRRAGALTAGDPSISLSTAFTLVCADPANASLVAQDRADRQQVDKIWNRADAYAKPGKPIGAKPALADLQAKAAELKAATPALTDATAFARVYADPANRNLVEAERVERKTRGN